MVLVLVVLLVPLYFGVVDGSDCGITVSTGNVTIKKCHIYVFMHTPRNYCYSWQYIQQIDPCKWSVRIHTTWVQKQNQ
jgi:hypothetical protein